MSLSFFDCNCMLGKRADRREGEPWSLEQLIEDMAYFGIDEALVVHAMSRDYDVGTGNAEVARTLAGRKNLHPVWGIVPPATGELPKPSTLVEDMLSHEVRCAISYPKLHNYSLSEWSLDTVLRELEGARIPLLLPFNQVTWDEVHLLCRRFPKLPVIITALNYRQLRFLLPLWEQCRNLYVDLSWFSVNDSLPFLAERRLLGQVLFGSNYPLHTPGAAITMVTYANVSVEQQQLVAGGTLRRLLSDIAQVAP